MECPLPPPFVGLCQRFLHKTISLLVFAILRHWVAWFVTLTQRDPLISRIDGKNVLSSALRKRKKSWTLCRDRWEKMESRDLFARSTLIVVALRAVSWQAKWSSHDKFVVRPVDGSPASPWQIFKCLCSLIYQKPWMQYTSVSDLSRKDCYFRASNLNVPL